MQKIKHILLLPFILGFIARLSLFSQISINHPTYIPWFENGLWGYADTNGVIVIPPQFEKADMFYPGGMAQVTIPPKAGGKSLVAMVDMAGKIIIPEVPSQYLFCYTPDYIYYQADTVKDPGSDTWGLMDGNGKMLTPPWQYLCTECQRVPKGTKPDYLVIRKERGPHLGNYLSAVIDREGMLQTGFEHFQIVYFGGDCFLYKSEHFGLWGMMDHAGSIIVKPQWKNFRCELNRYLDYQHEEYFFIPVQNESGAWGFVDQKGNIKLGGYRFLDVSYIHSGEIIVSQNRALPTRTDTVFFRMDTNGVQTSPLFPALSLASGWEFYSKKENGKEGIANLNGDWVVPPIYDFAFPSSTFLYAGNRKPEHKVGAFNHSGKMIYPPQFDDINPGESGIVYLDNGEAKAIGDTLGNILIPFVEVPWPQWSLIALSPDCIIVQPTPDRFEVLRIDEKKSPVKEAFPDAFFLEFNRINGKGYILLSRSSSPRDVIGWIDEDGKRFFK